VSGTPSALIAEVIAAVDYDPETGRFTWKRRENPTRGWNARYAGKEAGWEGVRGYRHIHIGDKDYLAHRLAWLLTYGRWPEGDTDHINCDKADNRIDNLREATRSENSANRPPPAHNRSGFKGVHFDKSRQKWMAFIRKDWRVRNLGRYATKEEAVAVRRAAELEIYGEFAHDH
jgi:hypothetical protein